MPETPSITPSVTPQVGPGGQLPMNASPASFGSPIAEGVSSIGEVAADKHRLAVRIANQTMALSQDNDTAAWMQAKLRDPKTGLLNQPLGRNAPGAVDAVRADFDRHLSKMESGLVNDEQKLSFQQLAASRRFELNRQLDAYEHAETTRDQEEVAKAALATTASDAVTAAADPDPRWRDLRIEGVIAKQTGLLRDIGRVQGLAPEAIDASVAEASSATRLSVVKALLNSGNDLAARTYYEENRAGFIGRDASDAAGFVKDGTIRGTARAEAARILTPTKPGEEISEVDALKEAEKITDTQVYDQTVDRITTHFGQQRQAKIAGERENFDRAQDALIAGGGDLSQVPVPVLSTLNGRQRVELNGLAKSLKLGEPVVTDMAWYRAFKVGLANPATRNSWINEDPNAYPTKLAPAERKELIDFQASLRKGDTTAVPGIMSRDDAVKQALVNGGMDRIDIAAEEAKPDNDPENPNAIAAINRVVRAMETDGKKLTPEQVEKVGNALVIQRAYSREVPRHQWNPAYWLGGPIDTQTESKAPFTIHADEIPRSVLKDMKDRATEAGITLTDAEMTEQYLDDLARDALNGG